MKRLRLWAGLGAVLTIAGALAGAALTTRPEKPPELALRSVQRTTLPLLQARLRTLADNDRFMGVVLVAKGDQVLIREAYGMADREAGRANTASDRFRLASVSKQFTAAAILRLQDQGKLSVDDPVCRWITPCPEGWADIHLSHLMSHTSGLPDLMDRPGWGEARTTPTTLAALTADTIRYRPTFPPGTKAEYDNAAFNLLAEVVERASGRRFEVFLQVEFFDPLGMADTGSDIDGAGHGVVMGYNHTGTAFERRPVANVSVIPGAGALYSTADDMLKWERALHRGDLLSRASYAQMIADHAPVDQGLRPGARPRKWGFGLFVSDLASGAQPEFHAEQIYHTGSWSGFRNMVSYQPEADLTVIVLTNNYHQRDEVFLIVQQAMAEALGEPFPYGLKS